MKPTRIVNIVELDHIPGFKELPMVVETDQAEYRLIIGELNGKVHGSQLSHGADIIIACENNVSYQSSWNPIIKQFSFARYTKALQAVYLEHFMRSLADTDSSPKHYHHLKTYSSGIQSGLPRTVPEGKYVIKPATGARSMAILTVDTTKMHIRELSNLLDMHIREYQELREKQSQEGEASSTQLPSRTEWVYAFVEKHNLAYESGLEHKTDEAADYIFNRTLIVQEFNPFIDDKYIELRALRCVGAQPLIYNRQDLDGSFRGYSTKFSPVNIRPELYEEIQAVLRHPDFPLPFGSVDIWVNNAESKWGIYEYQPEYCSINMRDEDHIGFVTSALDGIWNYCYR